MKNLKKILLAILVVTTLTSCSDDESNNNGQPSVSDNYYVKYVIKGNGTYGYFSDWVVKTDQANYTNSGYQVKYWSETFGPVKKGFKCDAQVKNGMPTIEIHVSKNQEPSALKVSKTGNSASYTIDF